MPGCLSGSLFVNASTGYHSSSTPTNSIRSPQGKQKIDIVNLTRFEAFAIALRASGENNADDSN
jgi:hypothetical protein